MNRNWKQLHILFTRARFACSTLILVAALLGSGSLPVEAAGRSGNLTTEDTEGATTSVDCGSGVPDVTYGSSITCVATVTRQGGSETPSGTVAWTTDSAGSFTDNPCTLSGSDGVASCSVTYTPEEYGDGTHLVTATYDGDVNFLGSSDSQTVNVARKALTVSGITAANKVYDGEVSAALNTSGAALVGLVGSDDVTLDTSGAAGAFDDKNVGAGKTVNVSGLDITGADVGNYLLTQPTATASISSRNLTVSATGVDKVYDGTTAATVSLSSDAVAGDAVTPAYTTASFVDKNVGTGKAILVSGISIGGADAGNYTLLNTTASTWASITKRDLTVSATGVDKVYNGTTAATVILSSDAVAGDAVTPAYTAASFADKNVGAGKAVGVSGISIGGADAGNYTLLATTAAATADITPRDLTVSAAGVDKVYDGSAVAAVTLSSDALTGDDIVPAYVSASFPDKNAEAGKSVNVSGISIGGADAGNYTLLNDTASTTASITPRGLTVSATASDKVYDGTPDAAVTLSTDALGGDEVTPAFTGASFADKNVGAGKTVSVTGISISGADAGNYTLLDEAASATASITPRDLTVSATGDDKIYDGATAAAVTLSTDALGGDDVVPAYAGADFDDKNVGADKTVSVSGISLGGADAGNYTLLDDTASTTASITPRDLAVSATGVNKVYDGATLATVTLSSDAVAGDDLLPAYTSASFADKNVGADKTVSVSGISIGGADAANYILLDDSANTTASITPRDLTVSAAASNKVYDGAATATVVLSTDALGGDAVNPAYASAVFADKNVGNGKTVNVGGITIGGADAGNYNLLNTSATAAADITPRDLTVSATGINKVYDGTTAAAVTLSTNALGGDDVAPAYVSASFATKTVGNGKTVSVSGISISGADAGNYTLLATTANTTANITKRDLTVSAAASDKVYDGAATATVVLSTDALGGDAVNPAYVSAVFADKNVGNGKTVNVGGITIGGADAGNYNLLNTSANAAADITPRDLTVSATGINKVYDGTTAAAVTLSTDALGGDAVTTTYTAAFTDKNVGNGKAVNVSSIAIGGADAGNYTLLDTTAVTTASITKRGLTVSATGVNKVYDGNTNATVTLSADQVPGETVIPAYTSASFANYRAGAGKVVNVAGISISGADIGNYTLLNTTAVAVADITPRGLTVSATGASKIYDGTTATAVSLSTDKLEGDVVTVAYTSAAFADKNAGAGKAINITGIFIGGADAGNYTLLDPNAVAYADILPKAIPVFTTGIDKVYDGTTAAAVTLSAAPLAGDNAFPVYAAAAFVDKNVGANKTVNVSGISFGGADGGNYQPFSTTASTTASITVHPITVTADALSKYLGQPDPSLTYQVTSGSVAPGDTFSGALARQPGEELGEYEISRGTLSLGSNYALTFVGNTFTILPVPASTFTDVPVTYWAWKWIESIYGAGITGGCSTSPMLYCPANPVTRAQMAIFLLRGIHGGGYTPPAATGATFHDVPSSYWAAAWIEQLAAEGITAGCGGGNYCPDDPVTRDQMAIFLLRSKYGSAYTPPPAAGTLFGDVPSTYWAASWIEQLAVEGITAGCGGGNYCPASPVTRDQMAVFIQRTFDLPLP